MDAIFASLAAAVDRPLDLVVHVGAGSSAVLERHARLSPRRAVLVEGDHDLGAALTRAAAGRSWVTVVDRPVAPQARRLDWYRYNLPSLNGPLVATPLERYYPRLRCTGCVAVEAGDFASLVSSIVSDRGGDHANALVLDVPGQEDELVEALPPVLLSAFDFIVLRGCREALGTSDAASGRAIARLQRECFDPIDPAGVTQPLWPVAVLRLDIGRLERRSFEQRIERLAGELAERADECIQLRIQVAAERVRVQSQRTLTAGLDAQFALAIAERDRLTRSMTELQARHEQALSASAEAQRLCAERAALIERLGAERDGSVALATRWEAQAQDLRRSNERAANLAAERQAQAEALSAAHAQATQLAARHAARVEELTRERDELAVSAATWQARIVTLEKALANAQSQATERDARIDRLEASRRESEQLAIERTLQIEDLAQARDAQATMASDLQDRLGRAEAMRADAERSCAERDAVIDRLTSERDEQARLAAHHQAQAAHLSRSVDQAESLAAQRQGDLERLGAGAAEAERTAAARAAEVDELTAERDAAAETASRFGAQAEQLARSLAQAQGEAIERDARIEQLAAEVSAGRDDAVQLNIRLGAERAQLQVQRQLVAQLEARVAELVGERNTLRGRCDGLAAERDDALRRIEAIEATAAAEGERQREEAGVLRTRLESAEAETTDARRSASLSMKLQVIRDADLRDLQARYQASLVQQQRQHELLTQLAERLTAAQHYFRQLVDRPETAAPGVVEGGAGRRGLSPSRNDAGPGSRPSVGTTTVPASEAPRRPRKRKPAASKNDHG